jgi:hypothetical protein
MARSLASTWVPGVAPPPEQELIDALAPMAVAAAHPAHRVLYSWTSQEQADELRRTRRLLTKGPAASALSLYDTTIWGLYETDDIARALFNPPFHRQRYAWPHPWATRLGGDEKPYGDALVRITLKPEALVVTLRSGGTANPDWAFFDMQNRMVPPAEGRARMASVAAVYHAHEAPEGAPRATVFREYVVCNESMVESWELSTEPVAAELERDLHAVDLMARFAGGRADWFRRVGPFQPSDPSRGAWLAPGTAQSAEASYVRALAFANERYWPLATHLEELRASLRAARQTGEPLAFRPRVAPPTLPRPLPIRKAVRKPNCVSHDTFDTCVQHFSMPCRDGSGRVVQCR